MIQNVTHGSPTYGAKPLDIRAARSGALNMRPG